MCGTDLVIRSSRDSDMVRDEISLAKKHGMQIIPAKIDDCEAPYGFGSYSSVDLRGWAGEFEHPGFQQFLRRLTIVVPPRARPGDRYQSAEDESRCLLFSYLCPRTRRNLCLLRR